MGPTYYEMEKLMRMTYDQKLLASMKKVAVVRAKTRDRVPPSERVPCRIHASGATAQ